MIKNELSPPEQLMKFIVGKWISKPVYVAAELGIADMLSEGPKSIDELALESRSYAPFLYRMMRALASVGIFFEREDRRFELTPMANFLKTGSMRSIALMFNSGWNDRAWEYFMDSVKTGETAFEKAHGKPVMDWLKQNPHAADIFSEANAVKAGNTHRVILDVYDFSEIQTLTDVGGGLGTLISEILIVNPFMKGVVADTSYVIKNANKIIEARGIADRCETIECDFFKSIPPGSDAYLLSNILHDWPDEECRTILENCRKAMKPDSRILLIEMIIPEGNDPSIVKLLDLEMLVITGGQERTEAEFKHLIEMSGLRLTRTIPTKENIYIIEGKPM